MTEKTYLIESGIYKVFLEMKKSFYLSDKDSHDIELYSPVLSAEQTNLCFKIYNANHQRKKRNLDDIAKWCFAIDKIPRYKNYMIIFGTLDFTDKALNTTTPKTRRIVVSRYIRQFAENYIANIDFGEKKGREHYHFIAFTKNKFDINQWNYGGGKFLQVPINEKDIKSTKNYVLKLNNHSYKESTKLQRVIKDKNNILDNIVELLFLQEFKQYKLTTLNL